MAHHHRRAVGHGLDRGQAVVLVEGGGDDARCGGVEPPEVVVGDPAQHLDVRRPAVGRRAVDRAGAAPQGRLVDGIEVDTGTGQVVVDPAQTLEPTSRPGDGRGALRQALHGRHDQLGPLRELQAPDAEHGSVAPGRAVRRRAPAHDGRVDPGVEQRHPVDPVEAGQPAPHRLGPGREPAHRVEPGRVERTDVASGLAVQVGIRREAGGHPEVLELVEDPLVVEEDAEVPRVLVVERRRLGRDHRVVATGGEPGHRLHRGQVAHVVGDRGHDLGRDVDAEGPGGQRRQVDLQAGDVVAVEAQP